MGSRFCGRVNAYVMLEGRRAGALRLVRHSRSFRSMGSLDVVDSVRENVVADMRLPAPDRSEI